MIEATVALMVTALGLALLAGIGSNMQKQVVAKQETDQFEWNVLLVYYKMSANISP